MAHSDDTDLRTHQRPLGTGERMALADKLARVLLRLSYEADRETIIKAVAALRGAPPKSALPFDRQEVFELVNLFEALNGHRPWLKDLSELVRQRIDAIQAQCTGEQ